MYKHRTVAGIPAAEILKLQPGDILALSSRTRCPKA
jgi:hypothetical protein